MTSNRTGSQGLLVSAATQGHDPYPLVVAEDGVVRLPLSTFDDYEAHYYTYMHEGQPIEFFVLKSKDGVVRAAFNACDVCFAAKKGYTQDGDEMICNNCGRRFPADQINVRPRRLQSLSADPDGGGRYPGHPGGGYSGRQGLLLGGCQRCG